MNLGSMTGAFTMAALVLSLAGGAHAADAGASAGRSAEDLSIRPYTVQIPQAALDDLRRRIAATRWPDQETVDDRSQGAQLDKAARAGSLLGHGLRLAKGRSEAERPSAIRHDDRRRRHSFHPPPFAPSERDPGNRHARLAGIRHRATQDHRSAHGSNRARRKRRGRFRRRHPVLAGLRLLRQADSHRLGPRPHRASLGGADEAPRIHTLRRARRRLGYARSPARWRARRPPDCSASTSTCRQRYRPRWPRRSAGGPAPPGLSDKERAVVDALMAYGKMGTQPTSR